MNSISYEKFLPLGTVITLKDSEKNFMISGYPLTKEEDYYIVLYPEGIIKKDSVYCCMHKNIESVDFYGYHTPTSERFLERLITHKENNNYSKQELLRVEDCGKYLPIGTVIFLKNTVVTYMICGYTFSKFKEFKYLAFPYPTGIDTKESIILVDENNIVNVRFVGYSKEEYQKLKSFLEEYAKEGSYDKNI